MMPPKTARFSAVCLALLLGAAACPLRAEDLRGQLESLARQNGIAVSGLEQLGADPARQAGGDVAQQLQSLLSDYNFMTVGRGGKIEKLTITSPKRHDPRPRTSGTVKTQRLGTHHQVQAMVSGPNNAGVGVTLLVDTGATTLMLPDSMIPQLGFDPKRLQAATTQTAGGSIPVRMGVLKSVRVGEVAAENVPVSFIGDQRLGGARLLGMSFLNRFRFSLDDEHNELLLLSK
jgi:aspartyl protease family protein